MSQHDVMRGRTKLAYESRGQGPTVVLVQGLGMAGRMWLQLPGGLLKSGYRVVIPDNRGTGRSDAPYGPYTMGLLADDLAAVIRDSNADPALVVGISLGGMIVQHLALRHPELVRGLVLAATTCGLPHGRLPNLRLLTLLPRSLRGDPDARIRIRELLVHPRSLAERPELFDLWDRQLTATDGPAIRWQGLTGQIVAAATHSTGFRLGRLRCPTVVIAGAHDQLIPSENARILAERIPGAELRLLDQTGHAFPLERPGALPDAIRRVEALAGARPGQHRVANDPLAIGSPRDPA